MPTVEPGGRGQKRAFDFMLRTEQPSGNRIDLRRHSLGPSRVAHGVEPVVVSANVAGLRYRAFTLFLGNLLGLVVLRQRVPPLRGWPTFWRLSEPGPLIKGQPLRTDAGGRVADCHLGFPN